MSRLVAAVIALAAVAMPPRPIVPNIPTADLVEKSNTIVLGTYGPMGALGKLTSTLGGTQSMAGQTMFGEVSAVEYLKGTGPAALRVEYFRPDDPYQRLPYPGPRPGSQVFFLVCDAGTCGFASPFVPSIIATKDARVARVREPIDKVAERIGAVLRDPAATASDRSDAVVALFFTASSRSVVHLERATDDSDIDVRYLAAASLMHLGIASRLPMVERALAAGGVEGSNDNTELMKMLRSALSSTQSERFVPMATRLMASSAVETRRAAVEALARSRAKSAIPGLVHALDDTNAGVRWEALSGLKRITPQPNDNPMSEDFCRGHEDDCLAYWREWAKRKGIR